MSRMTPEYSRPCGDREKFYYNTLSKSILLELQRLALVPLGLLGPLITNFFVYSFSLGLVSTVFLLSYVFSTYYVLSQSYIRAQGLFKPRRVRKYQRRPGNFSALTHDASLLDFSPGHIFASLARKFQKMVPVSNPLHKNCPHWFQNWYHSTSPLNAQ
ncbi:hypothetical protein DSO57_1002706 [Entomophthora muscae]|uniref:Uncharacterized protein n=1 Tax=Entomophthora muscae TaxID=34485 RepID=A0ACC2UIW2_9FUNG|nr:hypothetical protein DSO57_1002706 [Entomophthora muscae]